MPEAQFNAGVKLTAWILENKYPNCTIIGHRDAIKYSGDPESASACPGDYFPFDSMKNKVLDMLKGAVALGIFIDIVGHWTENDVNFLYQKGIVAGEDTPSGKIFRPDEFATRGEVAALLSRSLKLLGIK
jgi:hypothetical protein